MEGGGHGGRRARREAGMEGGGHGGRRAWREAGMEGGGHGGRPGSIVSLWCPEEEQRFKLSDGRNPTGLNHISQIVGESLSARE